MSEYGTPCRTHSTVHSPSWEANWFAASQEIPRISRNPKVHYRTHKRPPPVPMLTQTSRLIATNYCFSPRLAPVQLQIWGTLFILWTGPRPSGYFTYRPILTSKNPTFYPQTVFVCFPLMSVRAAIYFPIHYKLAGLGLWKLRDTNWVFTYNVG